MGGDRFVAAQRAGTVGGVTLNRARMVENTTIVVDKTYTQVRWRVGIFAPHGDVGGCPGSRARGATETAFDLDRERGG